MKRHRSSKFKLKLLVKWRNASVCTKHMIQLQNADIERCFHEQVADEVERNKNIRAH